MCGEGHEQTASYGPAPLGSAEEPLSKGGSIRSLCSLWQAQDPQVFTLVPILSVFKVFQSQPQCVKSNRMVSHHILCPPLSLRHSITDLVNVPPYQPHLQLQRVYL